MSKRLIGMQLVFFMLHQNPTCIVSPTPGREPGLLLIFLGHWAESLWRCLVEKPVSACVGMQLSPVVTVPCMLMDRAGPCDLLPDKQSLQHMGFGKNKWSSPIRVPWDTMPRGSWCIYRNRFTRWVSTLFLFESAPWMDFKILKHAQVLL